MKLTRALALLSITALAITGCSESEPIEMIEVPNLIGMPLPDAEEKLDELGFEYEEHDASDKDRTVMLPSNWEVVEHDPAAGEEVEPGSELSLGVLKMSDTDDEEEAEEEEAQAEADTASEEPTQDERQATDDGLQPTHAQVACTVQAEQEAYPDSIKVHTIMGKKQEVINADEIRFLWEATLTSAAGGELRGELLCIATGTNDNPEVTLEFR